MQPTVPALERIRCAAVSLLVVDCELQFRGVVTEMCYWICNGQRWIQCIAQLIAPFTSSCITASLTVVWMMTGAERTIEETSSVSG